MDRYSLVDPTDHTSDMEDAAIAVCTGLWVISSYPIGENFTDTVWYQASVFLFCLFTPLRARRPSFPPSLHQ